MIDLTFRNINRLFVISFENVDNHLRRNPFSLGTGGGYGRKLREKFSYRFLGQSFSVDVEKRGYTGKFWVKHLFLGQNVKSLDQFLPNFQSQKIWKPCILIDRSFYPEQKQQQLLKTTILQITESFVF